MKPEGIRAWSAEWRGERDQRASVARAHSCVMELPLIGQRQWRALGVL